MKAKPKQQRVLVLRNCSPSLGKPIQQRLGKRRFDGDQKPRRGGVRRSRHRLLMALPPLPGHRVSIVSEAVPAASERGFVYVRKLEMRATFANGEVSEPFIYDVCGRNKLDAVVVVPHYLDDTGYDPPRFWDD